MLHAPTSETKTDTAQSKTQLTPLSQRELHPYSPSVAGLYSLSGVGSAMPGTSPEEQRRQTLAGMQRTYGNQAMLRTNQSPQQVARMPALRPSQSVVLQRKCACGGSSEAAGECAECQAKQETTLQRRASDQATPATVSGVPSIVHDVLRSPGQPLDTGTRAFMEPRFGHDFSGVRVHTDARAAESARSVNALAYTVGRDVVFGAGQHTPGTSEGRRLMAHELTHVVQQGNITPQLSPTLSINKATVQAEKQAERAEDAITTGLPFQLTLSKTTQIARQADLASDSTDQRSDRGDSSSCGPDFCNPYATTAEANQVHTTMENTLIPLETATFGPSVGGLWALYLNRHPGDSLSPVIFSNPKNDLVQGYINATETQTSQKDFLTKLLANLSANLSSICLFIPRNSWTSIPVNRLLSSTDLNVRIDFSDTFSIPGNTAGGVGSSDAGPDWRRISGSVEFLRTIDGSGNEKAKIRTNFHFTVFDAIDFCPGNCGAFIERTLTVPLSRLEASGQAYDVPFQVEYDGLTIESDIDPSLIQPCLINTPDNPNTGLAV